MKWYVYIMTNKSNKVLYIELTNAIEERVKEQKVKAYPQSFTARLNCDKIVYFEEIENGALAVKREKQMKKWKRAWKINLIDKLNPSWADLSLNWNINYNNLEIKIKSN